MQPLISIFLGLFLSLCFGEVELAICLTATELSRPSFSDWPESSHFIYVQAGLCVFGFVSFLQRLL